MPAGDKIMFLGMIASVIIWYLVVGHKRYNLGIVRRHG